MARRVKAFLRALLRLRPAGFASGETFNGDDNCGRPQLSAAENAQNRTSIE